MKFVSNKNEIFGDDLQENEFQKNNQCKNNSSIMINENDQAEAEQIDPNQKVQPMNIKSKQRN